MFARIGADSTLSGKPDLGYDDCMRDVVDAALDYGLAALSKPDREPGPIPVALLTQARLAARSGVDLAAVLGPHAAGHGLLVDALVVEACEAGVATLELKPILRSLTVRHDRVVTAVSEEYQREASAWPRGATGRRCELLRRLLAGDRFPVPELGYPFDAHHVAIVAAGPSPRDTLTVLGRRLDRRLLLAVPDEYSTWAWLGGRRTFDPDELELIRSCTWPAGVAVGCGEPGRALEGWRLSHRQAAAALSVARRLSSSFVRYPEVALATAVLRDDLLAASLRQAYLDPLEAADDRGRGAKQTLRAYFRAGGNVSSAAAALGINRRTLSSRLSTIEERLGRPLAEASAEIETALGLDELEAADAAGRRRNTALHK